MKKYLLVFFTVALLAFMLASCVPQDHAPTVSFVNPGVNVKTPANNGLYGPGVYVFKWTASDIDKKDTVTTVFTLTHNGTMVEVTLGDDTARATLTDAGTYTAMVTAKDLKGLESSQKIDFTIQTNSNISFTGKSLFGFEYIVLPWKSNAPHVYQYKLDSGDWDYASTEASTDATLTFVPKSAGGSVADGSHYLFVRIADKDVDLDSAPVAVFPFTVDTTPPTIVFMNSDRNVKNYDNEYFGKGDSNPEGRYDLVRFIALDSSKIESVKIRFYEFINPEASDTSALSGRIRLALKSSAGDNVYDEWSITDASGKLYTSATQPWFDLDTYYINEYGNDYIFFNDNDVTLWGASGKAIAHKLFKLNTQYAMYVDMIDEAGNEGGGYVTFELKERYDSDGKPVVYVESQAATATKGSNITFTLNSKNVKQYCESGVTNVNYDVTIQSTLSYLQIPVVITSSATLDISKISVSTTNYVAGKKDLSGYRVVQLDTKTVLVELYKGFTNGTDETTLATDTLENITIATPSDCASDTIYRAMVGYEGIFAYYPDYKGFLPNPTFRDENNRPIDGISTYDTPSAQIIVNPSESK